MSRRKIKAHVFTGFSETGWGGVIITLRLWGKAVTEWTNEWELRLETAKEPSPLVRHVIPLYSIPNLYLRLVQDAVPEDLCINRSLESLRIFLKGRAEVRKRLTPCSVDSTQTSLYALQCQCGHGCWLDYAKNVMQFLRTGRGFAEVERRFWPGGGVETRAIFFFKRAKPEMKGQKQKRLKGCLTAFLAHLPRQPAEEHRVQNWLVRYLLQERNYPWGPLDIQGSPLTFSPQAQNNSSENKWENLSLQ